MRFGRRDHESYIGGYDPEHEMPDPGRDPRDRWQSDAYRRNAEDSRWTYRWNPDRFEGRRDFGWREPRRPERDIQPRDRYESRYADYDRDRWGYRGDYGRGGYDYDRDRGRDFDRDRGGYYGRDDYGRDYGERERYARDPWSAHDRYDRQTFRDDWEWMGGEWDREGRYGRGGGNRY